MITKEQIAALSKENQIDGFTVMREYSQLFLLNHLYQRKEAKKIYFKGGTAIRLLFGSPRFSEDLDFSTLLSKKNIKEIMKQLEKTLQQEIIDLRILLLYTGKETSRFRIKYQSINFKYPLIIRLDFHHVKKVSQIATSSLTTNFPIVIFPLISHLSVEAILVEKLHALCSRGKGRDFFDVWYLLEKGIVAKENIERKTILKKIKQCSQKKLNRDLAQFLPKSQREIVDVLKERLQSKFSI